VLEPNRPQLHRTKQRAGQVFRYAIVIGRAEHDITADVRDALTPTETQHFAAITEPRRAGELLRAIDSYPGQPSTAYALRLAPHLFVRPGELRFAEWREFDFNAAEWGIPAEKMMMDDYHLDPLSRQVIAIPGPTTWTACETERMCCASGEPAELGSLILPPIGQLLRLHSGS
jgi:integrase